MLPDTFVDAVTSASAKTAVAGVRVVGEY